MNVVRNGIVGLRELLFATCLVVMTTAVSAQEPVGHVLMAAGKAVRMDSSGELSPLQDKNPIFEGDTLQTSEGAMLQLKMVDNALLVLQ